MLLAEYFLDGFCRRARRKTPELSAAARKRLLEHPWPGNVRELRNLMERLAYLSTDDRIEAEDLAFILSPRGQASLTADLGQSLVDATAQFQTEYIRRQIEQSGGNMSLGRHPLRPAPLESLPQDAATRDGRVVGRKAEIGNPSTEKLCSLFHSQTFSRRARSPRIVLATSQRSKQTRLPNDCPSPWSDENGDWLHNRSTVAWFEPR